MRTSLNKIKTIDDYFLRRMPHGDALLFEANTLLNNYLADDVKHQLNTYAIISQYSRQKIKEEIIAVQKTLFTAPQHRGFIHRITNLFKKY